MLWIIMTKEFLEKVLTLRFFVALILSIVLTIVSVVVLSEDYAQELADYHLRTQMHAETSNEQLIAVDRKPSILTALFQGITKGAARSVRLLIGFQPKIIETIDDNPFSVLFPTVDLTFIIGIVMSLLALLFCLRCCLWRTRNGHTCVDGIAAHQKTDVDFGQMAWRLFQFDFALQRWVASWSINPFNASTYSTLRCRLECVGIDNCRSFAVFSLLLRAGDIDFHTNHPSINGNRGTAVSLDTFRIRHSQSES